MKPQPRYQPGDKIGGRYQVHQALMGGMGEVYLCLDLEENYPYALKTFQARYLTNPKLRTAFEHEVRVWVALEKHPNSVRCFNMEILDSQPFMVLEWIANKEHPGTDLRSWLIRRPLALQLALDFAIGICQGLLHAQQKQPGLIHRDLKPENILVAQGCLAKITDFGLAKIIQDAELQVTGAERGTDGRRRLVGQGGIVGTPPYMAPEQWRGEALDARTDIYALGCILYELLSGNQPFEAKTVNSLRQAHLNAPIPKLPEGSLSGINPILECCLAKEREQRFATVRALREELNRIYEEQFKRPPREMDEGEEFTAIDYTTRGSTYDDLHRYEEALADYNQAIAQNPELAIAYNNRGVTFLNLHRYNDALADFSQAITLAPEYAGAYSNRASTYSHLRRYDEAVDDHNQAIVLGPAKAKSYSNRGVTYHQLQQYDKALVDFAQAIELDPMNAVNYINRANTCFALQQYDKALADCTQAITLDPILVKAYNKRGAIYHNLQRYDEALADFSQAIQIDPGNVEAYNERGNIYKNLQRYDEAIEDFSQAVALDPNLALAYNNRGAIYVDLQQYDKALADLDHAIQLDPTSAEAYTNRGVTYKDLQRYDEALADFGQAITLDPNVALAYNNRGATYVDLQQYDKALPDLNRAIQLGPTNAETYTNRGLTFHSLQQHNAALADHNQAIRLNPNYAIAYNNRGITYADLQQYNEAMADFNRAIQLTPNYAAAYNNRGTILYELQRYDEALADYNQAIQLDPFHANAYFNIGYLLLNTDPAQALPYFEKAAQLGHPRGVAVLSMVKQMPATEYTSAQPPFAAFQKAGSVDEMRQAVAEFPSMTDSNFITAVEQAIAQQALLQHKPALEKRLAWLRQLAYEQNPFQVAFDAFHKAGSIDEMQSVIAEFPFTTDTNFISGIAQVIAQKALPHLKPALEQRLTWLRQIAKEQESEERN